MSETAKRKSKNDYSMFDGLTDKQIEAAKMLQSGEYTKGEIAENRHIILLHRKIYLLGAASAEGYIMFHDKLRSAFSGGKFIYIIIVTYSGAYYNIFRAKNICREQKRAP